MFSMKGQRSGLGTLWFVLTDTEVLNGGVVTLPNMEGGVEPST